MAIQKKLLHFNDKSNFELLLERGNILDTSIVFILSTGLIWTHGLYYNSLTEEIINLLDNIPTKVSLLENDSYYISNKPVGANVGDAVLVNKTTLKKVAVNPNKLSNYSVNEWEPIGVVVIPKSHNVYGTGECGVMALMSASLTTPDTGQTSNVEICWGAYGTNYPELNNFNQANTIISNGENYVLGYGSYPNLPSDNFSGNLSLDGITKYKEPSSSPSPYNADGSRNSLYFATGAIEPILPIYGENVPVTTPGLNVSWETQTGAWNEEQNDDSYDGKQFKSISPGSSGSTIIRCKFSGIAGKIVFRCKYDGENNYDYLTIGNLDINCTRTSYRKSLKGTTGVWSEVEFNIPDTNEHYVEFCYSKDRSGDTAPDCATVFILSEKREVLQLGFSGAGTTANALSDFAGKSNTEFFCSKTTKQENWRTDETITNDSSAGYHPAACACWRFHTVGTSQGDWYLPACGELGYCCVRHKLINETIAALQTWSGNTYCSLSTYNFWSSSEYDSYDGRCINFSSGYVGGYSRSNPYHVRPFLRLSFNSELNDILSNYYTKEESDAKYITDISNLATKSEIPTKTSLLTNDSNFLTSHLSLDSYYTKAETLELVNTKIQEIVGAAPEALDTLEEIAAKLNEDSDAITAINGVLTGKATKEEVNSKVSKNGDTINGSLTIKNGNMSMYNVNAPDSSLAKTFCFRDFATSDIVSGFGTLWNSNNFKYAYIGWGDAPWNFKNNLALSDNLFTYKNNQVITSKEVPLPTSSNNGNILQVVNGLYRLVNLNLEDINSYGVEWDITVADPHLTRIGNMNLHRTLPILSLMKGCICLNNLIMYWLDEDDWKYKKGGNPDKGETELLARLDGYDGTVRVYVPKFYIKSEEDGNKRRVRISSMLIDDTWKEQPACLVDAYRSTVLNTVPLYMGYLSTLPVNSAISVVNTAAYCRGGNNAAAYDKYLEGVEASEGVEAVAKDIFKTDLGKPRTYHPRPSMRTYSRNAGSEMLSYDQYKNIFYWLYVVEYANFNCLEAFNAELTDNGYHQGGLGNGVTNVSNWEAFNNYCPITPCGYGNDLGNGTGVKLITSPGLTPANGVYMCRWRGFDNPFGDIWTNLDGIIIDADADNHPNNMNYVYTCLDPTKYADNLNGDGYEKVGEEIHQDGYTKLFDLGDAAHIIPNVMGGNTTQYKCDYHWTGDKNATLRTLVVGGGANRGAGAGLGNFYSADGVSGSWADVGFRSVSQLVSSLTVL